MNGNRSNFHYSSAMTKVVAIIVTAMIIIVIAIIRLYQSLSLPVGWVPSVHNSEIPVVPKVVPAGLVCGRVNVQLTHRLHQLTVWTYLQQHNSSKHIPWLKKQKCIINKSTASKLGQEITLSRIQAVECIAMSSSLKLKLCYHKPNRTLVTNLVGNVEQHLLGSDCGKVEGIAESFPEIHKFGDPCQRPILVGRDEGIRGLAREGGKEGERYTEVRIPYSCVILLTSKSNQIHNLILGGGSKQSVDHIHPYSWPWRTWV